MTQTGLTNEALPEDSAYPTAEALRAIVDFETLTDPSRQADAMVATDSESVTTTQDHSYRPSLPVSGSG